MLDRLSTSGFNWHSGIAVPVFVVFIVGLAIFAYAKRTSSTRELQAFAIYLSLAAFLAFCAIVPLNPYWITLVAPFSILIIFTNPRYPDAELPARSRHRVTILFLIYMHRRLSRCTTPGIFKDLLFGQFIPPPIPQRFSTPGDILRALGFGAEQRHLPCRVHDRLRPRGADHQLPASVVHRGDAEQQTIKRSVVWVRIAALFGFCALLFGMYLIPGTTHGVLVCDNRADRHRGRHPRTRLGRRPRRSSSTRP